MGRKRWQRLKTQTGSENEEEHDADYTMSTVLSYES